MKELTKGEEQVMQVVWKLEKAFAKEIYKSIPAPRPAYNTVLTVLRVLVDKEFVKYEVFGKTHRYEPNIKKEDYSNFHLGNMVDTYFDGSLSKMVTGFVNEKDKINLNEIDEMMKILEELKKKK